MNAVDVLHQQSGPRTRWSRVNAAESMVGVQTPLSWTMWQTGGERGFRLGYRDMGLLSRSQLAAPESVDQRFSGIFYGRGATNIDTLMAAVAAMPGAGAAAEKAFFSSASGARRAGLGRRLVVWCRLPYAAVRLPRRLRRLRRDTDVFWRAATAPDAVVSVAAGRAQLAEALDRFGVALGLQILTSTGITLFYGRIQALLTRIGRPDLELRILGGYGSMEEIRLTRDLWQVARAGGSLEAVLAQHGFHGPAEGELSSLSWREDPSPLVAMVDKFRAMDADAGPVDAERHQAEARQAAEQEVLAALSGVRRATARVLLSLSRKYIPLRVEAKVAFMQAFDAARSAARAIGERWTVDGRLRQPDDVFYLTLDEILGTLPGDAAAIIQQRRAIRQSYMDVELPQEWVGMPEPVVPSAVPAERPSTITALGVSPGTARGTARVLLDAGDPAELQPGEVLVCHTTDPSWASYFLVASAVVIDIGGALSHGAIVARELGIPCVINTGTGTQSIATGDLLEVDGNAGTVEITRARP